MNKRFKYMTLAAAAMLTAGCSQDELFTSYQDDPDAVQITAQVSECDVSGGFVTRSTPVGGTTEDESQFKSRDRISVSTTDQGPVVYAFDGSAWTPENSKFLKWTSSTMTFTAYYPVTEGTNEKNFNVPADQSDADNIAAADYMTCASSESRTTGNNGVTLAMERKMVRIVINPILQNQFTGYEVTAVTVHGNSSGYSGGTPTTGDIAVKAYKHTDKKYYALLSPTTADNGCYFIDITITKGDRSETLHAKGIPATTAGNSYTVNLAVGRDVANITSITINDWTTESISGSDTEIIPYITFSAANGQTFTMDLNSFTLNDGEYFEYSVGGGKWTKFSSTVSDVAFGGAKGNLRLRGTSSKGTANDLHDYSTIRFGNNTKVSCTGDIRTLVDYEGYTEVSFEYTRFLKLFENCNQLTTAPDLPATNLADYCYCQMFFGCTSLTKAPDLAATGLGEASCYQMFMGCTALTTAPDLPATDLHLATNCYSQMFSGCTALTTAPKLPATTLATNCYNQMFSGCTALTKAPKLPATTLANYCYQGMFSRCSSLTTVPELPATTLANWCYKEMFSGCTSLTKAPELPATTLADLCYGDMFNGCTALTKAPDLPATTLAGACYKEMFLGCSKLSSVTMKAMNISNTEYFTDWLNGAGTAEDVTRTLTLQNADVYTSIESTLPDHWKKDVESGATVHYLDNSSASTEGGE